MMKFGFDRGYALYTMVHEAWELENHLKSMYALYT